MRYINFSDHLERELAEALDRAEINFIHESEDKEQGLDFYLPLFDIYIEVKQFHADRISKQMESQNNVIALQGRKSIEFVINLLNQ